MKRGFTFIGLFILFLGLEACMATSHTHDAKTYTVFVGTLGETSGILTGRFDAATGTLSDLTPAVTDIVKPSFIALHPNGRFLYAASEIEGGMAYAYAIAPGGKLDRRDHLRPGFGQPFQPGFGPLQQRQRRERRCGRDVGCSV